MRIQPGGRISDCWKRFCWGNPDIFKKKKDPGGDMKREWKVKLREGVLIQTSCRLRMTLRITTQS